MNDTLKATVFQLIDTLVILLSPDGKILSINQAALTLYGWELSHVIEQPFSSILDKSQLPSPLPETWVFPYEGADLIEPTETYIESAKKLIAWQLTTYDLEKGQGILCLGKDITALRNAEDKRLELDNIIAQVPANLYWFDKNFTYLGGNELSAKILGLSRQEAIGKTVKQLANRLDFVDKKSAEIIVEQGKKVIETGTSLLNIEAPPFRDADGTLRYYLTNKVPLKDRHGHIYAVIGISVDITPWKELEAKLMAEKNTSRSKSEFIANMSHDIRNPIAGILAVAQHILNYIGSTLPTIEISDVKAKAALVQMIDTIEQDINLLMGATHELLGLCNEILDVVQLESGKALDSTEEAFDIEKLLKHTIDLLVPMTKDKPLSLSFRLDPALPRYLVGARLQLNRILLNLTSNALKFTDKGFVRIDVKLAEKPNRSKSFKPGDPVTFILTVEDSGIGIPADKKDVIFEHFSQLASSHSGGYKGTGLGLYTVKRYLESMGGHIEVKSQVGLGTCFIITLTFKMADPFDVSREKSPSFSDTAHIAPDSLPKTSTNADSEQATVLVVEDNLLAFRGLDMKLKGLHCVVDMAKNGTEAVKMAESKLYDIIFMDVGLPDFSGVEATKKIRQLAESHNAQVPIVGLTGYAKNSEKRQECFEGGMQAVLNKPAELPEIDSALKTYVFRTASDKLQAATHSMNIAEGSKEEALKVVDWKACVRACRGDKPFVHEMLSILVNDLEMIQTVLTKAYTAQDIDTLLSELHRLRGGLFYLKLPELERKLDNFNHRVKTDPQDKTELESAYAAFRQAIQNFLQAWRSGALNL